MKAKSTAKYTVFSRPRGSRRWVRRLEGSAGKQAAIYAYQSILIAGAMDPDNEWQLRRVND